MILDKIANHFYFIHKYFIPLTLGFFFFKHLGMMLKLKLQYFGHLM